MIYHGNRYEWRKGWPAPSSSVDASERILGTCAIDAVALHEEGHSYLPNGEVNVRYGDLEPLKSMYPSPLSFYQLPA